ncbi:MAG: pantoate--beta-alanine ligase [Deltaproteobacteria bacterium]|nr:pantoate--beta-alanine ligase [Deltaproteobacteria bacterium]
MKTIKDISVMQRLCLDARARGDAIALVPTMGFLHDGHRALLRAGRTRGDILVLSIFVNPAQFGPKEDYASYPRDMERDLKIAEEAGADIVFTPEPSSVYPPGYQTYAEVTELTKGLCGASRPGHFRGVATIVLKLFNIVFPHAAIFGEKDFQQLITIKKMVNDLNLPIEIIGVETAREADGLAMSSRNSHLNPKERLAASSIPRALMAAKKAARNGATAKTIIEKAKKIMEKEPQAVIEYISVCDPVALRELAHVEKTARLLVAVRIGKTRLIDNCLLTAE